MNSEGESDPLESEDAVKAVNPYTVPDPPQVIVNKRTLYCIRPTTDNYKQTCSTLYCTRPTTGKCKQSYSTNYTTTKGKIQLLTLKVNKIK